MARAFKSVRSQAVRLPKAFRADVAEAEVSQRDEETLRHASAEGFERAFEVLTQLPADFLPADWQDTPPQHRA